MARRHRVSTALGLFSGVFLVPVLGAPMSKATALQAARQLEAPRALASTKGEFEGLEFWDENEELLKSAWQELGPRSQLLYSYSPSYSERYVSQGLRQAAAKAQAHQDEDAARALFDEVVPGVFASRRLFTAEFVQDLLDELEHIESSGIPRRRPNGMNRYGVILDQVGMETALTGLINEFVRPLAAMLFPELTRHSDAEEHYAFTIRYDMSGDTELAKHGDASVVTLNLCLGSSGWRGGELRFFESGGSGYMALPRGNESAGAGDVVFQPNMAVMHRGQHKHQAMPLLEGQRTNVVIWLMGRHGVVRIAPYPEDEQLTPLERWRPYEEEERVLKFDL